LISAAQVLDQLDGRIDLILDGGPSAGGIPSTVVDCTGDAPVIVRPGPLALEDLQAALR
jgi:L-threonylcarbamoyladenylate synthase